MAKSIATPLGGRPREVGQYSIHKHPDLKFEPCIKKTGSSTLSIKAGTTAVLKGVATQFSVDTPIVMPGTLNKGDNLAIYLCDDGSLVASKNFSAPTGFDPKDVLLLGGGHYGATDTGETVSSGGFATTGSGHIWTQPDVDKIKGINEFSIWDMKLRPACADPRGFARLPGGSAWAGIYFMSSNPQANGVSAYGTDIASGTVLPKIPTAFGGNGSATYAAGTWFNFQECLAAFGCRLPTYQEFMAAAYGVTENTSEGGSSVTPSTTGRTAGFTSAIGLEQATGHIWTWGADIVGTQGTTWQDNNGGRGQIYSSASSPLGSVFGGNRTGGSYSGSRASGWDSALWHSNWLIGARAFVDSMTVD